MTIAERFRRFVPAPFACGPWIFLAVAVYLETQAGFTALRGDLAEADPPAHFTTGVMLHDFVRFGNFIRPLPFAECFYVQYPKVALGHWPPVFYILEALWFFIFGTTTSAARWLCACIAGSCALLLYRRCRIDWGRWHGVAAAALFLALPVVQHQTWRVMSDLLCAGLSFVAICSLSDYLTSGKLKDGLWLVAWASLAILTKGTAWLLLVPIAAGPLFTGRKSFYAAWRYWLAISLVCIVSAPFFVLMSALGLGYPLGAATYIHLLAVILQRLPFSQLVAGGLVVVLIAAALYRWLPRAPLRQVQTRNVLFALWVATLVGFIELVPLTPERDRYFLMALAPAAYLLAGAMVTIERRLEWFRYVELFAVLSCAAILALVPVHLASTTSFSDAMRVIPIGRGPQVILLEGDEVGEGAMIAARLTEDQARSSYLVRGTKFLATSDWSGARYSLNYKTLEALRAAMDGIRLDYIVLDTSAPPKPDVLLMKEVLADPASKWEVMAHIPLSLRSRRGELLVYQRESQGGLPVVPASVRLSPDRGAKKLVCEALQGATSGQPKASDGKGGD
ncbi:MAG TPA: glycosyltransferase family 39 protein [Bryobacteraceae bacterium]|jgi:hypothetical protein